MLHTSARRAGIWYASDMPMFWNTLLGLNSFVIIPIAGLFLVYSTGAAILRGEWLQLGVAAGLLATAIVAEVILAIMDDA